MRQAANPPQRPHILAGRHDERVRQHAYRRAHAVREQHERQHAQEGGRHQRQRAAQQRGADEAGDQQLVLLPRHAVGGGGEQHGGRGGQPWAQRREEACRGHNLDLWNATAGMRLRWGSGLVMRLIGCAGGCNGAG